MSSAVSDLLFLLVIVILLVVVPRLPGLSRFT